MHPRVFPVLEDSANAARGLVLQCRLDEVSIVASPFHFLEMVEMSGYGGVFTELSGGNTACYLG